MKFLNVIWKHGTATILLYGGLAVCLIILLINTFYPLQGSFIDSTVNIFTLLLLADILYLKLEESPNKTLNNELMSSGIIGILPRMDGNLYKDLLSKPGKKNVLNIWVYNFCDISPLFKESIQHSSTTIHFTLLNPKSKHAITRGNELSYKNIVQTMNSNIDDIALFYSRLTEEQKLRVKVFLYDDAPKFTIYGCGDKALVGMFLPKVHALQATQFVIDGRTGHFSKNVWDYYDSLIKEDITETLLSRLK